MTDILVLSVLQGVAEFLPVSSSGHLVLAQKLLGCGEGGMRLEICLHAGTLLSVFAFYRREIWSLVSGCLSLRRDAWRYVFMLAASAVPAVLAYFALHDTIESAFENARFTGMMLVFTGVVLTLTRFMPRGGGAMGFARALLMGAGQALALLPGVSRSGMTLAAARAAKTDAGEAARFSFLMSAPLIIGGMLLQIVKCTGETQPAADASAATWPQLAAGAAVAAVSGYFALKLLVAAFKGRNFWLFGPYCIVAGLSAAFLL